MINETIIFLDVNGKKLTGVVKDKVASILEVEKFSHTTYASGYAKDVYKTHRYPIDKYVVECNSSIHTIKPEDILEIVKKI